ncbi:MAG: hypothetical protein JXC32_20055, partial [Anaerolineae bacterium]|nr:hypothetical protein [Anaerolineae bacterium]
METMSTEAFARAGDFVRGHARPLEQAIFAHEFEDGPVAAIWEALAVFQNADGGFGHGLESDLWLPDSSVLATTVGLQVLRAYGATSGHPLVKGAMAYLVATYDADRGVWPIIPPNVDDAAHAPWWAYSEDIADAWQGFLANPRAEIGGYLHQYRDLVPDSLREEVTDALLQHLRGDGSVVEMHDLLCYVRFAETPGLPEELKEDLTGHLAPILSRAVVTDPEKWGQYGLQPLDVVDRPASPFAGLF